MKKTLFLSAILATALCSSAFGATAIAVGENETRDISSELTAAKGIELTLADGATVTNTSKNYGSGQGDWGKQISSVTLASGATATLNVSGTANSTGVGLVASGLAEVALDLNGGTLIKTGDGQTLVYRVNAGDSAGTLQVDGGRLLLNGAGSNPSFNGANVDVVVNNGGAIRVDAKDMVVKSLTVNKGGEVTTAGVTITTGSLTIKEGATFSASTVTVSGAITMDAKAAMTLAGNLNVSADSTLNNLTANTLYYSNRTGSTHVTLQGENILNGQLDLSCSSGFSGDLRLAAGASLTHKSDANLWMRSNSKGILLEKGATFTKGILTITGLSEDANNLGQLVVVGTSGVYDLAKTTDNYKASNYELRNVDVAIKNAGDYDTDIKNKLVNSTLTYTNNIQDKILNLRASGNTLTGINMGNGATLNVAADTDLNGAATLNALTLSGGTFKLNGTGSATATNVEIQSGTLLNNFGTVNISGTVTNNGSLYQQSDAQFHIGTLVHTGDIIINNGKTLTVNNLTTTGGTIRGAGTLFVDAATTPNNTTLDLDSFSTGANNTILSLKQANGTLKAATHEFTNKIVLTNDQWAAAEWTNVQGDAYTFTGAIEGSGNMVFNGSNGKKNVALTLTGNLSGWTSSETGYNGLRATGAMNMDVTIGGTQTSNVANAFNADNDSKMNLTVGRDTTLTGRIHVTGLSVSASKTVTASNSHVQIANSIALGDGADLTISAAGAQTTGALTLGSGSTLTLGSAQSHNINLTTSAITVTGDSTLNANLVVNNNGKMDFSGAIATGTTLTMGCNVTIGNNVTVVIDEAIIEGIINRGETVTIIDGVDQITSLGSNWNFVSLNSDGTYKDLSYANLRLDTDGNGTIVVAPEPATATLSLLALAGLCARRRRH